MDFLNDTNIVVGIGFVLFVAVLLYYGVPKLVTGKLDDRAERIRAELEEARALREEAQILLASYERKQKEVAEQAESIVTAARHEAEAAAESAKDDIRRSVERRLHTATEQIEAAEQKALHAVKDRAVAVAVAAAGDVIRERMGEDRAGALIDAAIDEVGSRLH